MLAPDAPPQPTHRALRPWRLACLFACLAMLGPQSALAKKAEPVKSAKSPAKGAAPVVDKALLRRCADPKRQDTRECAQLRAASKGKGAAGGKAGTGTKAGTAGKSAVSGKSAPKVDDEPKPKALSAKEKKQIAALKATCADKKKAKTAQCKKFLGEERERQEAADRTKLRKLCKDKKQAKTAQCKKFAASEQKRGKTISVCGRKYGIAKKNEKVSSFARRYRVAEGSVRGWNGLGTAAKLKGGKRYVVHKSSQDGITLKGGVLLEGEDEHFAIQRPYRGWGKPLLVDAIRTAVHATQRQSPLGTQLVVGDLSKEGGGCLPPHKSHRGGVDADVGFYMRGAHQRKWLGGATAETLDADRTWQLLRAFISTARLQFAFIDYHLHQPLYEAALRAGEPEEHLRAWFQWPRPIENAHETMIRHLAGHDNHMHVRFICEGEDACVLPDEARARLENTRIEMLGSVGENRQARGDVAVPQVMR